jgi:hypothetical protein
MCGRIARICLERQPATPLGIRESSGTAALLGL